MRGNTSKKFYKWINLIVIGIVLFGCNANDASSIDLSEVEMIFWENQSWETGGGKSRLSIWADGKSEIMVVPDAYFRHRTERLRLRNGWTMRNDERGVYFVKKNVFPAEVARKKFMQALEAGLHLLETFKPDYLDGSGTVVGIQINGDLNETVIPMFLDRQKGTENHQRFLAVSKILSDFDTQPYNIQN
jgi:hypothetical protein